MLNVERTESMMTEPISVTASFLKAQHMYEIILKLHHHTGTWFGRGVYKADDRGEINLAKAAPLRGTYAGVRRMGLFEGLLPYDNFRLGGYCKCTPPNPLNYTIELLDDTGFVLHSRTLIKHWIHPAVKRQEVEENGICGTLYVPPGSGPFPTILDISGGGGGLHEHKGATLASEGYCVLSLAFFQYKSLVQSLNDLDLDYFKITRNTDPSTTDNVSEIMLVKLKKRLASRTKNPSEHRYFEKAIDWLVSQPFTTNVIGIQGVSLGGLLVNMLAVRHPEIIAVCSINGFHALGGDLKIKEHGKVLSHATGNREWIYSINGAWCFDKIVKHMVVGPDADIHIETAPKRTAFRFVASLDDPVTATVFCTRLNEKKLKETGHYVEVEFASGGHLMEPPYFPTHQVVYSKLIPGLQAYGGEPCLHGASQPHVWSNTLKFFERFLGKPRSLPDWQQERRSKL